MHFYCPWKLGKPEWVESCAVPEECVSMMYPPAENTGAWESFPELHEGCCPIQTCWIWDIQVWKPFLFHKQNKVLYQDFPKPKIVPRCCEARRGLLSSTMCQEGWHHRYQGSFNIAVCSRSLPVVWGFLWDKFCTLKVAVRQEIVLQLGAKGQHAARVNLPLGYFTFKSLSVRGLTMGSGLTGINLISYTQK